MDQSTIQQGLSVAQGFGGMGIVAIGLVALQIIIAWNVKKNAVDPTKLQDKEIELIRINLTKLWEKHDKHQIEIQESKIEIERRLTRIWAEEKVIPRLDYLNSEFAHFKGEVTGRLIAIEDRLKKND